MARASTVTATVTGQPEIVFDWKNQQCAPRRMPDAPARAFRDSRRDVHLFTSDASNWIMLGSSLNNVKADCISAFSGGRDENPEEFNDRGWIEAAYTNDGKNIIALISNDWFPQPNSYDIGPHYMSINVADSVNDGFNFFYPRVAHVLATIPFSEVKDKKITLGVATSSNIFLRGKFLYVFLGVRNVPPEYSGSCLFRTSDNLRILNWQYWDGIKFVSIPSDKIYARYVMINQMRCDPVFIPFAAPVELRSVSWFANCNCYIGLFEGTESSKNGSLESGFFMTTSVNLVSWTSPHLLMSRPKISSCKDILAYPSLLDPKSKTRNFSDITDHPYLYYTQMNRTSCNGTLDRDLVRVPVELK